MRKGLENAPLIIAKCHASGYQNAQQTGGLTVFSFRAQNSDFSSNRQSEEESDVLRASVGAVQ